MLDKGNTFVKSLAFANKLWEQSIAISINDKLLTGLLAVALDVLAAKAQEGQHADVEARLTGLKAKCNGTSILC